MVIIMRGEGVPQVEGYYSIQRENPKKCCGCEIDYTNCQKVKCCQFEGIYTNVKFLKKSSVDKMENVGSSTILKLRIKK